MKESIQLRQKQIQELANLLKYHGDHEAQSEEEWLKEAEMLFQLYIKGIIMEAGLNLKELGIE